MTLKFYFLSIIVGSWTHVLVIVTGSWGKVAIQPCCFEEWRNSSASGMPESSACLMQCLSMLSSQRPVAPRQELQPYEWIIVSQDHSCTDHLLEPFSRGTVKNGRSILGYQHQEIGGQQIAPMPARNPPSLLLGWVIGLDSEWELQMVNETIDSE